MTDRNHTPPRHLRLGLWLLPLALLVTNCLDETECDPGQELRQNFCFPAAEPAPGVGGAPPDGAAGSSQGGAAEPTQTNWQAPCQSDDDCGGESPLCAQAPLSYCTNVDCDEGEANEGICPEGWTCIPKGFQNPADPSACVKL